MQTIQEALAMQEWRPGLFRARVLSDYAFGTWAWGGLSASLAQTAAAKFVAKDTKSPRHPDVINMQIQYLRPLLSKDVEILLTSSRVTRSVSTVHVSIVQGGKECVAGYVNLSDLHTGKGPNFETRWQLHPAPPPWRLKELEDNTSRNWVRYSIRYTPKGWFKLLSLVNFLIPLQSTLPSMSEAWISPTDSRNAFTNDALGMIADIWPPFLENYNPDSNTRHDKFVEIARQQKRNPGGESELSDIVRNEGWTSPLIITTLSMTLEVKQRLPAEGVKWLYLRAYAKTINEGKYDVEVLIMDEDLKLVALSHQFVLATAFKPERKDVDSSAEKAKI